MLCLKLDLRCKYMLPGCGLHTDCFDIILSRNILVCCPDPDIRRGPSRFLSPGGLRIKGGIDAA